MADAESFLALQRLYRAVIAHDSQSDDVPNYQWKATLDEKMAALKHAATVIAGAR